MARGPADGTAAVGRGVAPSGGAHRARGRARGRLGGPAARLDRERSRWLRAVWLHDALRDAAPDTLERWAPDSPGPATSPRPGERGPRQSRGRDRPRRSGRRPLSFGRAAPSWDMVGAGALLRGLPRARARPFGGERRTALAARFPEDPAGVLRAVAGRPPRPSGPIGMAAPRTHGALLEQSRRAVEHRPDRGFRVRDARRARSDAAAAARARPRTRLRDPFAGRTDPGGGAERHPRTGFARTATRLLRERGLDVVFFGNRAAADSTRDLRASRDPGQGRDVAEALGVGRVVVRAGHAAARGRERLGWPRLAAAAAAPAMRAGGGPRRSVRRFTPRRSPHPSHWSP